VVDVLHREVELVLVPLGAAAELGAAVGQHPAQLHAVAVEEGHDAVVQQVGGGDRGLAVVELGEGDLRVGVDEGLLVDPSHPFQRADVEGVLGAAVARALALELAVRLAVLPRPLQGGDLGLGQHQPVLGAPGLQRPQPLLHGLEVVALPDAAHPRRGNGQAAAPELVGDAHLAEGGLLQGDLDHGLLHGRGHPVGRDRLAPGHLGQRQLAAFLVELLEAVEAVARVAQDLAGLADVAELLRQL